MAFLQTVRLVVPACVAKPSPSIGQSLGALGVNMMQFCKQFNAVTADKYVSGVPLRTFLDAYDDQSFKFRVMMPKTTYLLKLTSGVEVGANHPGHEVIGKVHVKAIYEIARIKQQESDRLQRQDLAGIARSIAASCKSMGLMIDNSPGYVSPDHPDAQIDEEALKALEAAKAAKEAAKAARAGGKGGKKK